MRSRTSSSLSGSTQGHPRVLDWRTGGETRQAIAGTPKDPPHHPQSPPLSSHPIFGIVTISWEIT